MIRHKFSSESHSAFANCLQGRVSRYFTTNNVKKGANTEMVIKTISAISIYLVPYWCMIFLDIINLPILFLLWLIMGFGKAFIGMAVMHDGLHGSYSKNRWINKIISLSTWLVGADPTNWKIQHNVLHHTFTNIEHADEDIEPRFIFRFSPNQPRKPIQNFQHIYAFLFYGLSTLIWVTVKDFIKVFGYKKEKLIKSGRSFWFHVVQIIIRKVFYFLFFLVIPIISLPVPFWIIVLMFLSMHLISGYILTFVFQCAHIVESLEFKDIEEEVIDENRLVHQLKTTSNFGTSSRLLFWFSGGLNHQIEHHLFPNICHIHYRKISAIVRATAKEYNLPYHTQPTLASAIYNHLKMLKALGSGQI